VVLLTGATDPHLRKELDKFIGQNASSVDEMLQGVKITVFDK
jgi:hypothetical protein